MKDRTGALDKHVMATHYPAICNLIKAYFNQDWDYQSTDPDDVIRLFSSENPRSYGNQLIEEIRMLLSKHGESESEFLAFFELTFRPDPGFEWWEGRTVREELARIADLLESSASE